MGVDERDDQAERLRRALPPEPALDLLGVELVPALPVGGVAAAEVLGLGVLAGVGRLPIEESVLALDPLGVGLGPPAQHRVLPAGGMGQVPLALVGDVVPALAEQAPDRGHRGRQLGLAAGARPDPQQAARELLDHSPRRCLAAAQDARHRRYDGGGVARVRPQVGRGQRQLHPVLGGVAAGEQRRPARRAHRGVAEGVVEGQARPRELGVVRHQLAQPAGVIGPVPGPALLIGDQQEQVRRAAHPATQKRANPVSVSVPFWPSMVSWTCALRFRPRIPR